MKIIEKNILEITKGVIVQQVNNRGVMGGGLALDIRNKWPRVYNIYKMVDETRGLILGSGIMVPVSDELCVYNMVSQNGYGNNGKYTDYTSMSNSLKRLWDFVCIDTPVYFPYMIGCGLGGGDWNIVSKILDNYFPNGIICKLPLDK